MRYNSGIPSSLRPVSRLIGSHLRQGRFTSSDRGRGHGRTVGPGRGGDGECHPKDGTRSSGEFRGLEVHGGLYQFWYLQRRKVVLVRHDGSTRVYPFRGPFPYPVEPHRLPPRLSLWVQLEGDRWSTSRDFGRDPST